MRGNLSSLLLLLLVGSFGGAQETKLRLRKGDPSRQQRRLPRGFSFETDCTEYRAFPGEKRYVPGLPDRFSRYDFFSFEISSGVWDAIRLDGEFPYARYFSVNIYDANGGLPIMAMPDFIIEAIPGHINPFRPGADRYAANRSFQIFLVPEESIQSTGALVPEGAKIVTIPSGLDKLSIVARVYRADEGFDSAGGVPPANVTFLSTQETIECPRIGGSEETSTKDALEGLFDKILFPEEALVQRENWLNAQGERLIFTRADGSYLYQNPDNQYVSTPLSNQEISVFQVRMPTFEKTYPASPVFQGNTEVRYWSACVGGLGLSLVSNCLLDEDIVVDKEGIATIVIAPQRYENITKSASFNFLPRGLVVEPVLIVRHLLEAPIFEGRYAIAPPIPLERFTTTITEEIETLSDLLAELDVQNFIGDFGPRGLNLDFKGFLQFTRKRVLN